MSKPDTVPPTEGKAIRRVVVVVLLTILALWAATLPVLSWLVSDGEPGATTPDAVARRGQIGDAFGSINALFSGLALAGVIVAILLQREELRLQRKELEETRAELKRQADAAEKQEAAIERQRRAMLLAAAMSGAVAERDFLEKRRQAEFSGGSQRGLERADRLARELVGTEATIQKVKDYILSDLQSCIDGPTRPAASDPSDRAQTE